MKWAGLVLLTVGLWGCAREYRCSWTDATDSVDVVAVSDTAACSQLTTNLAAAHKGITGCQCSLWTPAPGTGGGGGAGGTGGAGGFGGGFGGATP
jgi:hypothetical protein